MLHIVYSAIVFTNIDIHISRQGKFFHYLKSVKVIVGMLLL